MWWYSSIILILAVVDSVVAICALYLFAPLSRAELVVLDVIGHEKEHMGVWAQFFTAMFLILLSVYLHLNRRELREEGGKPLDGVPLTKTDRKIVALGVVFFCDVVPLVFLIKILNLYLLSPSFICMSLTVLGA